MQCVLCALCAKKQECGFSVPHGFLGSSPYIHVLFDVLGGWAESSYAEYDALVEFGQMKCGLFCNISNLPCGPGGGGGGGTHMYWWYGDVPL